MAKGLFFVVAALLLLPVWGGAAEIPKGGTLTIATQVINLDLDPDFTQSSFVWLALHNIYDTLFVLDNDRQLKSHLITKWELVDGKDYIFHLRKGVKFHDGTDFNAAAVKSKFERTEALGGKSRARGYLSEIQKTEIIDDYTVRIYLSNPSAPILYWLSSAPGFIYSPSAMNAQNNEMGSPVGAGAFRFVERIVDDHVTIKKYADYWEVDETGYRLPYLDQVRFNMIPDPTVRLAALRAGQVDMAYHLVPKDFAKIAVDPKLELYQGPKENIGAELRLGRGHPPYDNPLLIKAMAHAIDYKALSEGLYYGVWTPANQYMTPGTWAFDTELKGFYHDPEKAKALMAQAGYADGFKNKIEVPAGNVASLRLAEAIQSQVKKVGIDCEIEVIEAVTVSKRMYDGTMTTVTSINLAFIPDPAYLLKMPYHGKGAFNYHGAGGKPYITPGYDEILDKAMEPRPMEERIQLYRQAQRLLYDHGPNRIPLVYRAEAHGVRKGVGGLHLSPGGLPLLERAYK
jgi:peptide/nickel transport system substrate-binding protein